MAKKTRIYPKPKKKPDIIIGAIGGIDGVAVKPKRRSATGMLQCVS